MPRRSSVEKPAEDPNVEKRVTRGSLRKSEGGAPAVSTPEKQKDANKSKTQSPAKASPTPGKRGRPSKRSIAAAEEATDNTEVEEKNEIETSADAQEDGKDANNHDAPTESDTTSHASVSETVPEKTGSSGEKRLADKDDDDSEGPSAKKPRSEDEPVKEAEEAHSEETTSATGVTETNPTDAEKMETSEETASQKPDNSAAVDAPVVSATTETVEAVTKSNESSGDIPEVCSKPIPSESTPDVKATTEEVIKENGCREAENNAVASDAC